MYAVSSYIHEQISAQFEEYDHELKLNGKKKTTLVIFLLTLPCMISHIAKPEIIVDGFVACGMLDDATKTCPDMNQILVTCHRNITLDEHNLCCKKFEELYKLHLDQGHVPNDVYEEIGFPQDENIAGEKVRRPAAITQESYQRAKCLSHPYQKLLRKQVEENLEAKEHAKRVSFVVKYQKVLHMNVLYETCVLTRMNDLHHGNFDDVSVVELKSSKKQDQSGYRGLFIVVCSTHLMNTLRPITSGQIRVE